MEQGYIYTLVANLSAPKRGVIQYCLTPAQQLRHRSCSKYVLPLRIHCPLLVPSCILMSSLVLGSLLWRKQEYLAFQRDSEIKPYGCIPTSARVQGCVFPMV